MNIRCLGYRWVEMRRSREGTYGYTMLNIPFNAFRVIEVCPVCGKERVYWRQYVYETGEEFSPGFERWAPDGDHRSWDYARTQRKRKRKSCT